MGTRALVGVATAACVGLAPAAAHAAWEPVPAKEDADGESSADEDDEHERPPLAVSMVLPMLSLGAGPNFLLTPDRRTVATVELTLGANIFWEREGSSLQFIVQPGIGYAFDGPVGAPYHGFLAGVGVGVGNEVLRVLYRSRYRVGRFVGETVHGVRQTVSLELAYGLLGLEIGHDYRAEMGGGRHGAVLLLKTEIVALAVGTLVGIALLKR